MRCGVVDRLYYIRCLLSLFRLVLGGKGGGAALGMLFLRLYILLRCAGKDDGLCYGCIFLHHACIKLETDQQASKNRSGRQQASLQLYFPWNKSWPDEATKKEVLASIGPQLQNSSLHCIHGRGIIIINNRRHR